MRYTCTKCGQDTPREKLTVKRVSFQTMGVGFRTLKSKVVGWLCPVCREADDLWNAPKWAGTPGMVGTKMVDDKKEPV